MKLSAGQRLGPYEITAKLGEGGMGQVWKAKDFQLGREVALKVLPEGFTDDPERLARFEREARLLAQLNHPNIAQIYGMEASGDTRALVMELVEGPTLADRLESGALPLNESLSFALQITQALEEAHEKGIVHRDLKPQNIKASNEGKIKVLDFGLAKAMDPLGSASGGGPASQLAQSPTLTIGATVQGVILGTAAYMSPEQAKGLAVDKRADIWAFGVVLYEMLTGGRLFAGDSVTETLAEVLKREVDVAALPEGTPPAIRRLLRRCLERIPRNRLHDIGDARLVLEDALAGRADSRPAEAPSAGAAPVRPARRWLVAAIAVAAAAAAFVAGQSLVRRPAIRPQVVADDAVVRKLTFEPGLEADPAFSPDGTQVAYTTDARGSLDLAILPVSGGQVRYLVDSPGDEMQAAWSPDGAQLAFAAVAAEPGARLRPIGNLGSLTPFVEGRGSDLYLIPAAGGSRVRLIERGAFPTWAPDGQQIAFASDRGGHWDVWRIAARGGEPSPVVADEAIDYQPSWSPDGKWIAFGSSVGLRIAPSDGSGPPRLLVADSSAILTPSWSSDGRSIFFSWTRTTGTASLWQVEILPDGTAEGPPRRMTLGGQNDVDLAVGAGGRRLAWSRAEYAPDLWELERASGDLRQVIATTASENYPHLAPDGRSWLLVSDASGRQGVWTLDRSSGALGLVSPPERVGSNPRWSPDGRSIAYVLEEEPGVATIRVQERGSLGGRVVSRSPAPGDGLNGPQWSPDGARIVFVRQRTSGESEIVATPLAGEETVLARFPPATGRNMLFPSFLADGRNVVFQHEIGGEARQIWAVPAAGGEPRQLTRGTLELSHPQGSPVDADLILVVVEHERLGLVRASTGELTLLKSFEGPRVLVDYPSWSADGEHIAFSLTRKLGDLYLVENPAP